MSARILQWTAFAVIFGFLAASTIKLDWVGRGFFLAASICLAMVVVTWIREHREAKYSLAKLRDVHDQADLEEEAPTPDDMVYCMSCGAAYPAEFPACPGCARRR